MTDSQWNQIESPVPDWQAQSSISGTTLRMTMEKAPSRIDFPLRATAFSAA
jgi:hypothetical protein